MDIVAPRHRCSIVAYAAATDRDGVQAFLQELRRHDRRVVVRLADRRLQRLDDRVVVRLVEVDQRDQVLVRRLGLRRQHAVPVGLPPAAAPAGEQIAGVDREGAGHVGRVRPAVFGGPHLQAAAARLAVQDGDGAEVRVRADPELAGFRLAGHRHRRVPVDVHRVRGVPGVPGEEVAFQAQRGGAQHEQLVREGAHAGQVGDDRGLERGHLGRVDVGLEPVPVDVGVAGRLVGADRE